MTKLLERAARYGNRKDGIESAERFLNRCGQGDQFFGVEYVSIDNAGDSVREAKYLNVGETYVTTIIEEDGECFVSSWGEWYESAENDYCKSEECVRCGYCSHFTPFDFGVDDWHSHICEHCGNCVSG